MERPLALVVDKDPAIRNAIRESFEKQQIRVVGTSSESEALDLLKSGEVGILILDLDAPDIDVLAVAREALSRAEAPQVIGVGDRAPRPASDLLALGGSEVVLLEPSNPASVESLARRVLRERTLRADFRRLEREAATRAGREELLGRSDAIRRLRERLHVLSGSSAPVWLAGEPGTGKEHAARALHRGAGGDPAAFVVVRGPESSGEGWEDRWLGPGGWLERAQGGAIFVEALSQVPLSIQERLAASIAGSRTKRPPIRWFVSVLAQPDEEVLQGRVAEALRRALAGEVVATIPLRQRSEDIPLLAQHFLNEIREINRLPQVRFAAETLALLERYRWPGNVRELREAIEQAVILASEGSIHPEHLPEALRRDGQPGPAGASGAQSARPFREAKREVVEAFEQAYLRELMHRHSGNVTAASQQAGMLRSALQRLLRKYTLKSSEFRKPRRPRAVEEVSRSAGD